MNFRVALAAVALITASGPAHAQTLRPQPLVDRVVVHIDGKPMPAVRAELARAAEAVCRSEPSSLDGVDVDCVDATYLAALRQVKLTRAAAGEGPALTRVASR